jgi:hypothetical protein
MVMAALSDSHPARLVELRQLAAGDLNPLLDEETVTWRQSLDWDFLATLKQTDEANSHKSDDEYPSASTSHLLAPTPSYVSWQRRTVPVAFPANCIVGSTF